jgi:hypothetical protein
VHLRTTADNSRVASKMAQGFNLVTLAFASR